MENESLRKARARVQKTYAVVERAEKEGAPQAVFDKAMKEHLEACDLEVDAICRALGAHDA